MSRPLTFRERQGIVPPPSQLKTDELSNEIRARLWAIIYSWLEEGARAAPGGFYFDDDTAQITVMKEWHVRGLHRPLDEFEDGLASISGQLKERFYRPDFFPLFDFLEFVFAAKYFPMAHKADMETVFEECLAAWRIKGDHIVPVGSAEEASTVAAALTELDAHGTEGTKAHLRKAAQHLSKGQWADSVRESVSAVEAAARAFDEKKTLGEIVGSLAKKGVPIHPALARSMGALYGYTSDQPGLRHSLTVSGQAAVDEHEALLVYGVSVSFSQYLVRLNNAG